MYDGMVNKKYTAKIKSCTTSSIYYVKYTGVSKSLSYKDLSDLENLVVNTYIWEPFKSIPANSRPAEAQQAIYSSKGAADVFKNNIKEALKQKTKGLK